MNLYFPSMDELGCTFVILLRVEKKHIFWIDQIKQDSYEPDFSILASFYFYEIISFCSISNFYNGTNSVSKLPDFSLTGKSSIFYPYYPGNPGTRVVENLSFKPLFW